MAFRIFVLWSQLALTFADYELNRNFEQGLGHGQFILHNNSYLAVLKLSSENTSDPRECVFACVVSPLCLSYNVASTADNNGKFLCEILGTDKYRNPSQFIRKTNSKHYSISSACASNPCKNGSTCIPNYSEASYQCACAPMFNEIYVVAQDCTTVYRMGKKESGLYCIDINIKGPVNVFCDMATDGGGWTVIQRRKDGSVDFHRNWANYKLGFGNLTGEFWLGNDKIHELTSNGNTELRVELEDWDGNTAYAKYGIFKVADESKKYKLTVGSYSGTAGDALTTYHNGNPFTTRDRDNDKHSSKNCANIRPGAWWFVACLESHLNGQFSQKTVKSNGIVWKEWKKNKFSLKTSQMMIRRPSTVD